jgi:Transglutaminase-like superfamily
MRRLPQEDGALRRHHRPPHAAHNASPRRTRSRHKNKLRKAAALGSPSALIFLLLSCHSVTVFSMSILVIHGASASASPHRRPTKVVARASLREFDDAGAALVEVQDTLLASLPPSEGGAEHGGSGCPSPSSSSSPPAHKKPPLFSLRNWFAPRPMQATSSSSASSRTCHAHALSMSAASSTSTTSLGSLSTASILCAEPLSALLVEEPVVPSALHQPTLQEQIMLHEPDGIVPSASCAATIAVEQPPVESVHLQLTGLAPDPPPPNASESRLNNQTLVRAHSFVHDGNTYLALNTPRHKFVSFLSYLNLTAAGAGDDNIKARIQTRRVVYDAHVRQEWRELWKRRQLLTDRTELLAVYPSDSQSPTADPPPTTSESSAASSSSSDPASDASSTGKRGGFADLLHLYTERFAGILADEQQLHQLHDGKSMLSWLQGTYGHEATRQLQADAFRQLAETDQRQTLQAFLEWFRSRFPYYYDRCGSCGASMKEDLANFQHDHHDNSPVPPAADDDDNNTDDDNVVFTCQDDDAPTEDADDEEEDDMEEASEYQTFIGYIYPSDDELVGKASRTELYRCHVCHDFTRFPRFNSAWHVLEQQRGRCGEYSMLLYRFLRALDHPCRWVVDWSDHVWAEIMIGSRWVHLDPCEAAVDQNLLYQGWGKKQTYILGFAAPSSSNSGWLARDDDVRGPLIEDITSTYTSDAWETICQRRDESENEIKDSIEKAVSELRRKLPTAENVEEAVAAPMRI